ncbi:MAG: 30S ribosomal protein S9 [Candidatus Pacearchaeota archaeon]|jgi:small subunit ribosomal protein S9
MNTRIITSGKRKTSVARAVTMEGNGKITINGKPYEILQIFDRLKIEEPIRIAKNIVGKISFDIKVNARGGGEKGQIEASRIAISRALVAATGSKELEKAFLDYDRTLLVADVRRKEAYKPGDSKARRKRQTSYR